MKKNVIARIFVPLFRRVIIVVFLFSLLYIQSNDLIPRKGRFDAGTFYNEYHSVSQVLKRLGLIIQNNCPFSSMETIGMSHHGYPIVLFRLGRTDEKSPNRILITAGMHGRERSTSLIASYVIERFCYQLKHETPSLLNKVEVIVVPILNPDSEERARIVKASSRKNLRPNDASQNPCADFGVDLNRNWPTAWGMGNGSSTNPCNELYAGPFPLSEPETSSLAEAIKNIQGIKAHVDLHSFGQFIFRGWAYSGYAKKIRNISLENSQRKLARAFRIFVRKEHGIDMIDVDAAYVSLKLMGKVVGGVFMDYMMYLGVPSLTIEIQPKMSKENLRYGYETKKSSIVNTSVDIFNGIKAMLLFAHPDMSLPEYSDREIGDVYP